MKDLTGMKFGNLTVIKEVERATDGRRTWLCSCSCGSSKKILQSSIANTASCGCSRKKPKLAGRKKLEIGSKFNKLTAIAEAPLGPLGRTAYLFRCDCGTERVFDRYSVVSGSTKSCGCMVTTRGGLSRSKTKGKLYKTWYDMIDRCYNPNSSKYSYYGGDGVKVCDEWRGDDGYFNFIKWAEENGYSDNLRLDKDMLSESKDKRIYSPETCHFISQSDNTSYKKKSENKSSKYIGVSYCSTHKGKQPWQISIKYGWKQLIFKRYYSEKEAAIARNNFITENNLPHILNNIDE